ncbi:MAG TPA: adenylate/guanylate cyclase domain-containing protein [Acidimicrobiia bacterium]|nr:adenylate/guanylate cyclase domain-containing protein [Acidimicrobiia bacterium]
MRDELRRRLADLGAADDDLDRAEREGWLPLLALDRVLLPGAPIYDVSGVARATGVDESLLHRLWLALGFPDVPSDAQVFTESEVAAARRLFARAQADDLDRDALVRQVRVVSASMARVASVEADAIVDVIYRLAATDTPVDEIAEVLLDPARVDDLATLIDYEHRLQLRAALWRRLALDAAPAAVVAVGFADLAGYTKRTEHLDADEIASLVERWEERAYDTVTDRGARVVKTIGDEVMFVGLVEQAVDAALALRDAAEHDEVLLPVRTGLASGAVVLRNGDVYGPVVNLASRLTEIAPSGTILVPASLRGDLHDETLVWEPFGTRRLRSIGPVEILTLRRSG